MIVWVLTAIFVACGLGLLVTLISGERTRKPLAITTGLIGFAVVLVGLWFGSLAMSRWLVGS